MVNFLLGILIKIVFNHPEKLEKLRLGCGITFFPTSWSIQETNDLLNI